MALMELSTGMRDVLIAHLDGNKVPFILMARNRVEQDQMISTAALMRRQMLKPWRGDQNYSEMARPKFTVITDIGREALGKLLGDYADAIVRAKMMRGTGPGDPRRFGPMPVTLDDLSLYL